MYILQQRAYAQFCHTNADSDRPHVDFESWCNVREKDYPHFQFWVTVMLLELTILVYVRSLREADFKMYLDALTELAPWFFALDHTDYATRPHTLCSMDTGSSP